MRRKKQRMTKEKGEKEIGSVMSLMKKERRLTMARKSFI